MPTPLEDVTGLRLPTGTVTFLLTDVEGSTPAWEREPSAMVAAMARHTELVDAALARHNGARPRDQGEGDSVLAAFATAGAAVECALELQRAFAAEPWPTTDGFRVRMAVHTGEADAVVNGNYQGVAIIRAARVRSLASGGQILLSSSTADVVADRLPHDCTLVDLGFHALKGLRRPERVSALHHPELAPVAPPAAATGPPEALHLPPALSSFIGREAERQRVIDAVAHSRIVTIVGEGGAGKTRLAMEVAAAVVTRFADGAWMVDFAPTDSPGLGRAVAETLQLPLRDDQAAEQAVLEHLGTKNMLVVLDNAEHVIDAVRAFTTAALGSAEDINFLITSQVPTQVAGEVVVRLDAMDAADAVRLFVERAQAVAGGDMPLGDVSALCERLEGLPLAIELAASRVSVLSVPEIAARLDDSFKLLRADVGPERHRTMLAVLDWSCGLLDEREARVFRRLSVFPGEFSLDLAEAVAAGDDVDELDVLDALTSLIDRSLVRRHDVDGASRYRLLVPVRAYASERLREAGEEFVVKRRLLESIRALVAAAEIRGPNGGLWSVRLLAEIDSIRAVLEFGAGEEVQGIQAFIMERTARLWPAWGLAPEAKATVARLLAATNLSASSEASLRFAAGYMEMMSGNVDASRRELEIGITRARAADDRRILGALLNTLGILSWNFEHTEAAFIPLDESLAIFVEQGDQIGITDATYAAGLVAWQGRGDLDTGGRMIQDAVRQYRALGDRASAAECETCVASLALQRGEYEASLALWESIVSEFRDLGDRSMTAMSLGTAGLVASWSERLDIARTYLTEATRICGDIGETILVAAIATEIARIDASQGRDVADACARFAAALSELNPDAVMFFYRYAMVLAGAELASRAGDHVTAAKLFGAMASVAPRASILPDELPPSMRAARDETVAALGEDAFASAAAEGTELEWADLYALAASVG